MIGRSPLRRSAAAGGRLGLALVVCVLLACAVALTVLPTHAGATASYSAEEMRVLELINEYREANGSVPLLLSDSLSDAGTKHNLDMGRYGFTGHTTKYSDYFPVGSSPWDRMRICGYAYNTSRGEVLGYGFASAEAVVQAWQQSPGHNTVLLGSVYRVAGVSLDEVPGSPYRYYWTIDFGAVIDPSAHKPGESPSTTTSLTAPTTTSTAPTTTTQPTTTTTSNSTTTTTAPTAPFIDVPMDNPYYREISTLAAASIVSGYPDSSFRPNNEVTRAQFAKIVMLAIGKHTEQVEGTEHPVFRDVTYTGRPYPFDFVQEAAALGIIKGSPDGAFWPYQNLTRAQLALMLVRAGGADLATPPAGFRAPFVDVPEYAREAVTVAFYNQLLSGKTDTSFDPYGVATRGQVARMVYQLMERLRN